MTTEPRYEVVRSDEGWFVRFIASNGMDIWRTSGTYTQSGPAENAIRLLGSSVTKIVRVNERTDRHMTVQERFDEAVLTDSGCRLWQGYRDKWGYGSYGGVKAYRLSHEMFIGPIPPGMTVDHICFQPSCIEPSHLQLLTKSENAARHQFKPNCRRGHPFTAESTYVTRGPDGKEKRRCRICISARKKQAYAASRAER